MKAMDFRHEWKHEINYSDLMAIRSRLWAVAEPDSHGGQYWVRSLYFDDPADHALRAKLDGLDRREKFRLRYYNGNLSMIRLEKKSKLSGLCRKQSTCLDCSQVQAILDGDYGWMAQNGQELVQEFRRKLTGQLLRPRTIVDYTREPYVYHPGNVRVTLDYGIRTGLGSTDFLDPECLTIPVRDTPIILEVKWDAFLPSIIRDAVQLEGRHTAAFSKYAACRIYG